jgi:hypothetical protein
MPAVVTVQDFEVLAQARWGAKRPERARLFDSSAATIQEMVDFNSVSPELRVHLAETIIRECTPRCGGCAENGDARWFLQSAARAMVRGTNSFDGRRLPAIRAGIMLIACARIGVPAPSGAREGAGDLSLILGMGGEALAAAYLLSQLEYLFRISGSYLDKHGVIQQPLPPALAELSRKRVGERVNRIQHAFALYLHGNATALALRLSRLEADLDVGHRLKQIRDPVMHGPLGDASAEGLFYGLLVSMFYFSEP